MTIQPRAELAAIRAYVPGKPAPDVTGALKLASNENPLGPSPRALEAIAAALPGLHRYPDPQSEALKAALSEQHGLARDHLLVGNGSDDVIHLLASAYLEPGRLVVLADPPYSIHRIAAQLRGATLALVPVREHVHDLDAMARVARPGGWVAVTNPHNPTGTAVEPDALRRFVDSVPEDCLILLDEAYFDFVEDGLRFTGASIVQDHPNLVVLRTFSKAYGLAGLRVGYAIANPAILEPVERVRPPFNVGVLGQAAALAALADREHLERTVSSNVTARRVLLDACAQMSLEAIPSQTNFVLVANRDARGRGGWPEALAAEGISVRPGENLGMRGWHRVTLGTPEDMQRVGRIMAGSLTE